jgi:hypothetical protein
MTVQLRTRLPSRSSCHRLSSRSSRPTAAAAVFDAGRGHPGVDSLLDPYGDGDGADAPALALKVGQEPPTRRCWMVAISSSASSFRRRAQPTSGAGSRPRPLNPPMSPCLPAAPFKRPIKNCPGGKSRADPRGVSAGSPDRVLPFVGTDHARRIGATPGRAIAVSLPFPIPYQLTPPLAARLQY